MAEVVAAIFVFLGSAFTVFAGIGVVRFKDVFIRMHAATKVGTLGSGLIMIGAAIVFADTSVVIRCALIAIFLLLTAPIGAHMIGRAALRTGIIPWTPQQDGKKSAPEKTP